jgi:hypothetical protein
MPMTTGEVEGGVALYLAASDKIVVNRDSLEGKNGAALREALFHELVHVAQKRRHPEFFESIAQAIREAVAAPTGSDAEATAQDTVRARLSLIEGHAAFLQSRARKDLFSDSNLNGGWRANVSGIKQLLSRSGRSKLMQYVAGSAALAKVVVQDPSLLDRIFARPELADALLRSSGPVIVHLPPGSTPGEQLKVAGDVTRVLESRWGKSVDVKLELSPA